MPQSIVLLCDNKRRDLPGLALIAHHLEAQGKRVFVEPIEAWRSVVAAHRPAVILFNHLLATHLADYSARLASMGVKVAVLPNESLLYNPDVMRFNSRRYKDNSHADMYFCWNDHQRTALLENGYDKSGTEIVVAGNPKFDFHFAPWNQLYAPRKIGFRRTARSCFFVPTFASPISKNYHRRRRTSFSIFGRNIFRSTPTIARPLLPIIGRGRAQ